MNLVMVAENSGNLICNLVQYAHLPNMRLWFNCPSKNTHLDSKSNNQL